MKVPFHQKTESILANCQHYYCLPPRAYQLSCTCSCKDVSYLLAIAPNLSVFLFLTFSEFPSACECNFMSTVISRYVLQFVLMPKGVAAVCLYIFISFHNNFMFTLVKLVWYTCEMIEDVLHL